MNALSAQEPKHVSLWSVALLLMGSGVCALIYQTVWLRELRLIRAR